MISPERLAAMQAGWVQLLARFSVEPVAAYSIFDHLVAAHSEPHRHYHNLEHLYEMFRVVGKLADAADDPAAIQLAIWFHDSIYDPQAKENEARSADLAVELLWPLGLQEKTLVHVGSMIKATAHTTSDAVDADTAVLLDADLAILSAEEKRYARYAADIRKEYAWADEQAYQTGRITVLERFLSRPRIYRTERMYAVAEGAARRNIMDEMTRLRNAPPPNQPP